MFSLPSGGNPLDWFLERLDLFVSLLWFSFFPPSLQDVSRSENRGGKFNFSGFNWFSEVGLRQRFFPWRSGIFSLNENSNPFSSLFGSIRPLGGNGSGVSLLKIRGPFSPIGRHPFFSPRDEVPPIIEVGGHPLLGKPPVNPLFFPAKPGPHQSGDGGLLFFFTWGSVLLFPVAAFPPRRRRARSP